MKTDDYVYAVAYTKTLENKNLTQNDFHELINAENLEKFLEILEQKGYKNIKSQNFDETLREEIKKVADEVSSVCEGEFLEFFLLKNDFHNLKILLKAEMTHRMFDDLLLHPSLIDTQLIKNCILNNDFNSIPESFGECLKQASELLKKTYDPQMMEIYIDKFLWSKLYSLAKKIKNDFLLDWVRLNADIINMKVLARGIEKEKEFINNALIECGNFDFTDTNFTSIDEAADFFIKAGYQDGGDALKKSVTEFEKWCDNLKIKYLKKGKNNYFGIEPVFSFLALKEYELQALRIIFYAKKHKMSPDELRRGCVIFMGRIAVIGDYESICAYDSVGFVIYPVRNLKEAKKVLEKIKNGDYPVVFICENYIKELDEVYNSFCNCIVPAIIPIPSGTKKYDYAVSKLKGFVEKAVGSDIIFK